MAQDINILDPLGIGKVVTTQINQMATQANLPKVPEFPVITARVGAFPLANMFNNIPDRQGYSRSERV